MWPAIIGAAGSLLSTGMNNMQSSANAAESYERQKKLMALQQQYAVENWNREVNYNDPKEQMKRLKDAGLNPNLVYGSGAAGLEAPSTAAPTAPSAPMAQTVPMSNPMVEGAQAALALSQAKKTDSETVEQNIRNKYVEREVLMALDEKRVGIELSQEQKKYVVQQVQASQAEIDALKQRLGNEKYDRFLATLTTFGQLDKWEHDNALNDEQKKWLGTHAMAAMIGARGAAAQANAIAEAVRLFRHPDELRKVFHDYVKELKDELKNAFDGTLPGEIAKAIEDWENGNYFDSLFGRGSKQKVKDFFKRDDKTPDVPLMRR